jgi:D-galactose 1-dehydrogenase
VTLRIALVGMGKIARDQHIPALAADRRFELVAVASPHHRHEGVANHPDIQSLLAAVSNIDAVSLCTPPQIRYEIARYALEQRRHVMLEKPPGATLSEVAALADLAQQRGVTLFATWHSREAAGVGPLREWLATRKLRRATINWKEDVRLWHPGQKWIWKAGGLGVFDPGINALSIITRIVPTAVLLKDAELSFPANCETPIAATLALVDGGGADIHCEFDFRQTGPQIWDMEIETDAGRAWLSKGGSTLHIDGQPAVVAPDREYPNLYARFAHLVLERRSDVDVAPLRLVADALMCGRRREVEPFIE